MAKTTVVFTRDISLTTKGLVTFIEAKSPLGSKAIIAEEDITIIDARSLNDNQMAYLMKAKDAFLKNPDCWSFWRIFFFYGFDFGGAEEFFPEAKTNEELVHHPLYEAIEELWLALGVNQGKMKSAKDKVVYVIIN